MIKNKALSYITLHTLSKNYTPIVIEQQFSTRQIASDFIFQTIYFDTGAVSGTRFIYYEEDGSKSYYLVSETISQISNMINPPLNWRYSSGISGTVILAGSKKIKEITAIAQESSATIQINGGDVITLPYGSTDHLSTSFSVKPDNLIDPTIIFTGTKSYFIEYYQL